MSDINLQEQLAVMRQILVRSFDLFTEVEAALKGETSTEKGLAAIERWLEEINPEVERYEALKKGGADGEAIQATI